MPALSMRMVIIQLVLIARNVVIYDFLNWFFYSVHIMHFLIWSCPELKIPSPAFEASSSMGFLLSAIWVATSNETLFNFA